MNRNSYIFDKREIKKTLKKYGLIFAIIFPFLLTLNIFLEGVLDNPTIILIDVVFALFMFFLIDYIMFKILEKREKKREEQERIQKRKKKKSGKQLNNNSKSINTREGKNIPSEQYVSTSTMEQKDSKKQLSNTEMAELNRTPNKKEQKNVSSKINTISKKIKKYKEKSK